MSTVAQAAKRRYQKRGPTGFLKPLHRYSVSTEHKGIIHKGTNKGNAERAFKTWCRIAPGKTVMLFCYGNRIDIRL